MQKTYRHAWIYSNVWVWPEYAVRMRRREGEMRPGRSQGADCLPVSLLLLRSSSQAQVCVGSGRVLSDDSKSCCVLALSLIHTHKEKHIYYTLAYTVSDLQNLHTTSPKWTLHIKIIITWHSHVHISASFFSSSGVWKYIRPHAVCSGVWQGARENKAIEIDCCLTMLPYGHWIHSRPARTRTTHRIDRYKTTAALYTIYDCIIAERW